MKERPILFTAPMVRAILDGSKTQTRRICLPAQKANLSYVVPCGGGWWSDEDGHLRCRSPYGILGDRLWVRETFIDLQGTGIERRSGDTGRYAYRADTPTGTYGDGARKDYGLKWKPSIFMPRVATRITLEVTGVSIERLQDISVEDAVDEGVSVHPDFHSKPRDSFYSSVQAYRDLWEKINGPGTWDLNPWVWVVKFKQVLP